MQKETIAVHIHLFDCCSTSRIEMFLLFQLCDPNPRLLVCGGELQGFPDPNLGVSLVISV